MIAEQQKIVRRVEGLFAAAMLPSVEVLDKIMRYETT